MVSSQKQEENSIGNLLVNCFVERPAVTGTPSTLDFGSRKSLWNRDTRKLPNTMRSISHEQYDGEIIADLVPFH